MVNLPLKQSYRSTISKERKLMICCLTGADDHLHQLLQNSRTDGLQWDLFLQLCFHHRVYPVVFKRLQPLAEPHIPVSVMKQLADQTRHNKFMALQLVAELEQLLMGFEREQIRSLVLKGPALAYELYGDFTMRPSRDLDILIHEADLIHVNRYMTKSGYTTVDYPQDDDVNAATMKRIYNFTYVHPNKNICVEIHFKLGPQFHKTPAFEQLWERRRELRLIRQQIPCLGREDLLLYLALHGAKHAWYQKRWILDIDRILRTTDSGERFLQLAVQHQAQQLAGQAVALSYICLDSPLPSAFQPLVMDKRVLRLTDQAMTCMQTIVDPEQVNIFEWNFYRMKYYTFQLYTTFGAKLEFLFEHFYPSEHEVKLLAFPKPLKGLYFALRPILWLWHHTNRRKLG